MSLSHLTSRTLVALSAVFFVSPLLSQQKGEVYIVYGSDTAIWNGMDTRKRHPTYDLSLYTSPTGNAATIMTDQFRNEILDSYGQPLIMTWWMMAGNIFRDGTNTNVPYANVMTMFLMKKYYGTSIAKWGDELSLHYHTFFWSDYDGDGVYWWNQAMTFNESREDFDYTLAQQLIEEDVFPVSFRSGWHYMDNAWQQRLDELLPYSMHDAWPSRKLSDTEPRDNVIDWSRAPSTWVPYHPDPNDYQVPGPGHGWNLRSRSLYNATRDVIEPAFVQAAAGHDQILCLWDHLPDANIFDNLRRTNALLHTLAQEYAGVSFRFVTAVEGMQRFLGLTDTIPPGLTVSYSGSDGNISLRVLSDEPLFQPAPFVAVKTLGEEYAQVPMSAAGLNEWVSSVTIDTNRIARIALGAIDTSGNLQTWHHAFVPPDMFVDDASGGYREIHGAWTTVPGKTWGTTVRQAQITSGDSASVSWEYQVPESRQYAVFIQLPPATDPPQGYRLSLFDGTSTLVDTLLPGIPQAEWFELGIHSFPSGQTATLTLTGYAMAASATLKADVVRFSPLVPEYKVTASTRELSLGFVSLGDTIPVTIHLRNEGRAEATVSSLTGRFITVRDASDLPKHISPGSSVDVDCVVLPDSMGMVQDTALIRFQEPSITEVAIPLRMTVERAVQIVDNDVGTGYSEGGSWKNSVVTSYGPTSRYVLLSRAGGEFARFATVIRRSGHYKVSFLVPSSENATDRARYTVQKGDSVVGVTIVSQRPGGVWTDLGVFYFSAETSATVTVWNDGTYTSGAVLRADAMKFSMVDIQPLDVYLLDNDSSGVYHETGNWFTSVAQVIGPSSRYGWVSDGADIKATFNFQVWQSGDYGIEYIVPTTVNSATGALYRVFVDGEMVHSSQHDQNAGSGSWVALGTFSLPAFRPVVVEVSNDPTGQGGTVLRADAIRAVRVTTSVRQAPSDATPWEFGLQAAFPNPFNATTTLRFTLPQAEEARLMVHDLLGREIKTLASGMLEAGEHVVRWSGTSTDGGHVPSGVYLARLTAGSRREVVKLLLLK